MRLSVYNLYCCFTSIYLELWFLIFKIIEPTLLLMWFNIIIILMIIISNAYYSQSLKQ